MRAGTCKVQNECKTNQNHLKRKQTKRNRTKNRGETKLTKQSKTIETKLNKI